MYRFEFKVTHKNRFKYVAVRIQWFNAHIYRKFDKYVAAKMFQKYSYQGNQHVLECTGPLIMLLLKFYNTKSAIIHQNNKNIYSLKSELIIILKTYIIFILTMYQILYDS